jgi:hypothetical protein
MGAGGRANLRPLACKAWRSLPVQAQKCLQIRRNGGAHRCSALALMRPNAAQYGRFGLTNGPTARSTRGTWRRQIAPATISIAITCIGAAVRRIVTRRPARRRRRAARCRLSSMRQSRWLRAAQDRRIAPTAADVGDQQGAGEARLAGPFRRKTGARTSARARGLLAASGASRRETRTASSAMNTGATGTAARTWKERCVVTVAWAAR